MTTPPVCTVVASDAVADSLRPVPESLGTSLYFAAVSLLTFGYGDYVATDGLARVLAIAAAANGLGVVALTITYLFSLYANLQRREVLVATLDARAGSPPSGVRLLERAGELDMRADLDRIFQRWEEWSAEMLDQVEFEAARERLRAAGFGLRPKEQSWRDFQVVRAALRR